MSNKLRKYILPLAFIYFISPVDLMPFIPFDDLLFAAFALLFYFKTGNSTLIQDVPNREARAGQDKDTITTKWSVVEDE